MSIKCMNYVWEHSETTGADRLMLLAIADSCSDDGEWSSGVTRLADKCKVSERAAQYTLRRLEECGELEIRIGEGFKTKSGRTNKYIMKRFKEVKSASRVQPTAPQEVQPTAPQEVQPTAPKSSVYTSVEPSGSASRADADGDPTPVKAQPPRPTAKHRTPGDPRVKEILNAYVEVRGQNGINYGKEGSFAKKIVKDGGTPEEVKGCYTWMKADPWWEDKPLSLSKIFETLPEYKNMLERRGISPTVQGEDKVLDFVWE